MIASALRNLKLGAVPVARLTGRLTGVSGLLLKASGCPLETGRRCVIESSGGDWIDAQVVGFNREESYLMPFKKPVGLVAGAQVLARDRKGALRVGRAWLGRVINGLGEPIDGHGPLGGDQVLNEKPAAVNPLRKRAVRDVLDVGVRAINGALTLGKGQRVGLMAGSGVGKSVLLGMMTRATAADVVVVGLIGERGREVREFVEHALGDEGLAKAVLVVAPADESPLMRLRAAELCHAIAAHYRDAGSDVLLLVDSLTRYAMAQREIALSLGEPPATRGYPPSVFGMLPQLVETAGNGEGSGSMSAIYTVLAEGDDQNDPVVDTARAILDGHIVLSRELAERGHYPAIDVTRSVSRCMAQIADARHVVRAGQLKEMIGRHEQVRDLIPLGGYVQGADAATDRAVAMAERIDAFLRQPMHEAASFDETYAALEALIG
ncbi:flagellar protein export ATPase FliI [Burkholderia oklahomensis]|uniref:flagellar protein export ATPase FliI n=1 Tax=Burkholderia oklahomensis TaxID=342113 RepID=UPI00016A8E12|nr:flagellar protein export ATPase FliI [Burkholderia oklahomensis]AJX36214.1 ATPase, FliI/YscN family protein [Burkholderia oklahomensis C6786]AOI47960.1 flagellar protein export ATPase FliI [Burkholderia oklahomensis C6786]KUY50169.1 flagellar protein export ATPase FliI [Burkholderia oklahomensis C6786]MBI0363937.1 flagellar protein export ATPase FliI [Burkholderia oklahomensis]SUY28102.1 Flagellum-specific ATP synthase [Burkholderia oklahomensis]